MSKKKKKLAEEAKGKKKKAPLKPVPEPAFKEEKFNPKNLMISIGALLIIGLSAYFLYADTADYDMVFCDDNIFVIDNAVEHKALDDWTNPEHIKHYFSRTIGVSYYRPILSMSFMADANRGINEGCKANEIDESVFHETNIFFHILASCLVFIFLRKIGYSHVVAGIFGLLLAVHPVLTPAAAWISGRNDSMITVFILLTFISLVYYYRLKSPWSWLVLPIHLIFFAASLFTKEIAAFFPFAGFAFIFLFMKSKKIFDPKHIIVTSGWLITGLIWFSYRLEAISKITSNPDTMGWDAIVENWPTVFTLFGKLFVPYKMIALSTFEFSSILIGLIFFIVFILAIIKIPKIDKYRAWFGMSWFLLFMLPTLLVRIDKVGDFFDYAEHRAYLMMVGIFIVLIEILRALKVDFKKPLTLIISALLIVSLAYQSYGYKANFHGRQMFWQRMVDMYPYKSRGYLDLGKAYFMINETEKAKELYKLGIERNPNNKNLYLDLAAVFMKEKKIDSVYAYAKHAVSLAPGDQSSNYYLAKSLFIMGKFKEAKPYYEVVAKRNRKWPYQFIDIGLNYFRLGEYNAAIKMYQRALAKLPKHSLAHSNMGAAYAYKARQEAQAGDIASAKTNFKNASICWQNAIVYNPKTYDAYINLIRFSLYQKQNEEGIKWAKKLKAAGGKCPKDARALLAKVGYNF